MTPQELKNSILQLAIQGKLVEQRPEEGTAAELVEKILAAKNAKSAKKNLTRSRGARGENKTSATSASPREKIPDDEKPFDIPESWEWVRLESIINSIPSKQYQILESEVKPSGVFSVISQSKEYSIGFTDKSEKVYHHVNPVIVFGDHTAEVKFVEFDFVVGADGVKIFEPLDGIVIAKFLFYVLQFHSSDLSKVGGYSRHYKFLKDKPIPLPPLAEQKRIVAKIEELLPLIDRYEKAWSKLEDFNKRFPVDMQKSLLQLAIQGKLVEQRAEEGTAAELLRDILTQRRRDAEVGRSPRDRRVSARNGGRGATALPPMPDDEKPFDIPESWVWVRIKDIATKITDGTHHSPPNSENGDYMYVTAKNIKDQGVSLSNISYVSSTVHEEIVARCNPEFGDILLIKDGATTGVVTVNNIKEPFSLLSSVALLKMPKSISAWYFVYVLRSDLFYKAIRAQMKGTGITRVTLKQIENFVIPLPPLAEQKRIVAKLEELLPLCERLK